MPLYALALTSFNRYARPLASLFLRLLSCFFRLAVKSVTTICDRSVLDTCVGGLEATSETINEHLGALKSQAASKDPSNVLNVAQVDTLDWCIEVEE